MLLVIRECICAYVPNWFISIVGFGTNLGIFLRLGFGTNLGTLPLVQMWTWFILIVAFGTNLDMVYFDSLVQMWTWFILVVDFGTNLETPPLMLCPTGLFLVEDKRTETKRQWSWTHWLQSVYV